MFSRSRRGAFGDHHASEQHFSKRSVLGAFVSSTYRKSTKWIGIGVRKPPRKFTWGFENPSRIGGRPRAVSVEKFVIILKALDSGMPKAAICKAFRVKRVTLINS